MGNTALLKLQFDRRLRKLCEESLNPWINSLTAAIAFIEHGGAYRDESQMDPEIKLYIYNILLGAKRILENGANKETERACREMCRALKDAMSYNHDASADLYYGRAILSLADIALESGATIKHYYQCLIEVAKESLNLTMSCHEDPEVAMQKEVHWQVEYLEKQLGQIRKPTKIREIGRRRRLSSLTQTPPDNGLGLD